MEISAERGCSEKVGLGGGPEFHGDLPAGAENWLRWGGNVHDSGVLQRTGRKKRYVSEGTQCSDQLGGVI